MGELRRTPCLRSSQNAPSRYSGEWAAGSGLSPSRADWFTSALGLGKDMPYTLCFSLPRRKGVASVDDTTTTVVGIFVDDPLTSRILGLLLEGAGYEASPLEEAAVLEDPSTALAGADLVLFMPLLGDERKGELL